MYALGWCILTSLGNKWDAWWISQPDRSEHQRWAQTQHSSSLWAAPCFFQMSLRGVWPLLPTWVVLRSVHTEESVPLPFMQLSRGGSHQPHACPGIWWNVTSSSLSEKWKNAGSGKPHRRTRTAFLPTNLGHCLVGRWAPTQEVFCLFDARWGTACMRRGRKRKKMDI